MHALLIFFFSVSSFPLPALVASLVTGDTHAGDDVFLFQLQKYYNAYKPCRHAFFVMCLCHFINSIVKISVLCSDADETGMTRAAFFLCLVLSNPAKRSSMSLSEMGPVQSCIRLGPKGQQTSTMTGTV